MKTEISFEEWVSFIFDHRESDTDWVIEADAPHVSPSDQLNYLVQLFENAESLLAPYSDAQVNNGLWVIAGGVLGIMEVLFDDKLKWARREHCIRSMKFLYQNLFAKRCSPHLGHLDEPDTNPINIICYMWWDILPIAWGVPPYYPVGLEIMSSLLEIDSIACQESALHGLGHVAGHCPNEVAKVIDAFLEGHPNLRPELRTYALSARSSCVL